MECKKNENGHFRGLHVVVIDPSDGSIDSAEVFDTYSICNRFDAFIEYGIPDGRIVVAAV